MWPIHHEHYHIYYINCVLVGTHIRHYSLVVSLFITCLLCKLSFILGTARVSFSATVLCSLCLCANFVCVFVCVTSNRCGSVTGKSISFNWSVLKGRLWIWPHFLIGSLHGPHLIGNRFYFIFNTIMQWLLPSIVVQLPLLILLLYWAHESAW